MRETERFAKGLPFPDAPASAGLRKAQVRAALFRKLEPIRIGRFILLEPLGAGAMGEIYAAYDDQLDRKVALKLVRGGTDLMIKADERLLREAQTLAQVSHPNVVQIYEAGTYNGRLFIAMELIRGKTLSSWLKNAAQVPRPVRQREILRQFIAAGRGLEAAHAAGLAHRDFKPDNVLVGDDGRVRVVDFGLARALVGDADGELSAWSGRARDDDRDDAAATVELSMGDTSLSEAATILDGEGGDMMPLASGAHTIVHRPAAARVPASRAATADPLAKTKRVSTSDERRGVAGNGDPGGPAGEPARHREGIDPAPGTPKLKAAVRLTETGAVMGTPSYMAPETMRGAIADQRSDQFSFCVALYQALYEAFPFPGKSLWELMNSMESGEIAFVPGVPVPTFVRKALYRGLSVEPSQRFAGMGELLAALEPRARRLRSWIAVAVCLTVVAASAVVLLQSLARADLCAAAGTAIDAPWSVDRQVAIQAAFGRSDLPFAASAWRGVKARVDRYAARWRGEATAACRRPTSRVRSRRITSTSACCASSEAGASWPRWSPSSAPAPPARWSTRSRRRRRCLTWRSAAMPRTCCSASHRRRWRSRRRCWWFASRSRARPRWCPWAATRSRWRSPALRARSPNGWATRRCMPRRSRRPRARWPCGAPRKRAPRPSG